MNAISIIIFLLSFVGLGRHWANAGVQVDQKLSLPNVIDRVEKNHPEIDSLKANVLRAEAVREGGPSIPPPMISISSMGDRGPVLGLMENSVEISQTIPFPTKWTAELNENKIGQELAKTELTARRLSLNAEAKGAFFDLYGVRKEIDLLLEKRNALENHAKRIRSLSLSDRMTQVHLIRIQTEAFIVDNDLEKARQIEKTFEATLNVTMGEDPNAFVSALNEPSISDLPSDLETPKNLTEHPQMQMRQLSNEMAEAKLRREEQSWMPDFSIKYRFNRRYDGVMPNNSEFMLGVDLPFLFFWQPRARVAESHAVVDVSKGVNRQSENELKRNLVKAKSETKSLRVQLFNFLNNIIPEAQKRMQIAHRFAPTDMESISEHRESMESFIDYRIAAIKLRVEYEKAVSNLAIYSIVNMEKK